MENKNCDILLKALKDRQNATIRSIAGDVGLTERECEIAASLLMKDGLLKTTNEILKPSSRLKISDEGQERLKIIDIPPLDFETASKTHMWHPIGSHAGGAGQITRDKWYPMGSYCRKCGALSRDLKRNPKVCPKK